MTESRANIRSRATATMLVLAIVASLAVILTAPAFAYTCDITTYTPINTTVGGETKIRARGKASCPNNTEYKSLKVTLVRVISFAPDSTVKSTTVGGSVSIYEAWATGCNKTGTHGHKSVVAFTNQPQSTSGQANLYCQV